MENYYANYDIDPLKTEIKLLIGCIKRVFNTTDVGACAYMYMHVQVGACLHFCFSK